MTSFKQSIGNPRLVSLDDVCYLLAITTEKDELGQPIKTETPFMVFCSNLSITRAEYQNAGILGYKPDVLLIVDSDSYDNEKSIEYHGKKYSVYRNFRRIDGFTEVYCEVKAGD
jgi:SPP1 family predicted phage head-tail adaptor